MKINIKKILGLLFFALIIACQNVLEKYPLDVPNNSTFYSNKGEIEMGVNGVYNRLWWHIDTHHALLNLDNTTDIGFLRDGSLRSLADGTVTSLTPAIESMWIHLYTGVGRANDLLHSLDKASGVVNKEFLLQVEAEARFLRAYFYHHLVELFGDVPLLTQTPFMEEANIAKSSKLTIVDQIIEDLQFAKDNLPLSWQGDNIGRITKGAATLLMARVALYNCRFELAATASEEIMSSNIYRLFPSYKNLFDYDGIRCEEVILDVPYQQGVKTHGYPRRVCSRMAGGTSTVVPSQAMIDSYLVIDGLPIDKSPLYNSSSPFINRDPRMAASIIYPQSVFYGYVFETHPDSTKTWQIQEGKLFKRVGNQDVTNSFATFTGYLWRKYNSELDLPARRTASELNFILMRYAEVLLTYAEAKIEMNDIDQSVLDAINTIRARAYGVESSETDKYPTVTTTDQTTLRTIIRTERKIELAGEGFRLYDIRRWKVADKLLNGPLIGRPIRDFESITAIPEIDENGNPVYDTNQPYRQVIQRVFREYNWLFPIPQEEINVNDNITQNEGY
jgi:hypothetical protein